VGDARNRNLAFKDISSFPEPILTLNGARIPYRADWTPTTDTITSDTPLQYLVATVHIPNSLLKGDANRAGVLFPLLGESWSAEDTIYNPDAVEVTRMSSGKSTTLLFSRPGFEFNGAWQVILDKAYPLTDTAKRASSGQEPVSSNKKKPGNKKPGAKRHSESPVETVEFFRILPCSKTKKDSNRCSLAELVADSKFLNNYQKLILVSEDGVPQTIDLSPGSAEKKGAASSGGTLSISSVEPSSVGLNEVVTVTVSGSNLDKVKQVSFDGKPLSFWKVAEEPGVEKHATAGKAQPAKSSSQIKVLLSRDVTSKEGEQSLLLKVDDKSLTTAVLTVNPSPTPSIASAPAPSTKNKENQP
jgi:hypothetical protein